MSTPHSTKWRIVLSAAALTFAAGGALAAPPKADQIPADLVKAAQAEGSLTFYSSADADVNGVLLKQFQAAYGIKGVSVRLGTTPLLERLGVEIDNNGVQADVITISSPLPFQQHPDWFGKLDLTLPSLKQWPAEWMASNNVGYSYSLVSVTYNTDQVKADEIDTWDKLVDPKWKGKVIFDDPRSADNYMAWLNSIRKAKGLDFLKKIAALDVRVEASAASGSQMVAAGSAAVNWPTPPVWAGPLHAKGAPVADAPVSDPLLVSARQFAYVAKAPHPNAAKLFIAWITSEEGIRAYCSIDADSIPTDPKGALGCRVAGGTPEPIDYSYTDQERTEMLQALGLSAH